MKKKALNKSAFLITKKERRARNDYFIKKYNNST